jgi:uncharacterized Zn-binding protein involved in type VI secretion
MPAAVRLADMSAGHCFSPRPNDEASPNVFINGKAAHRVGDHWPTHCCGPVCHDGVMGEGSPNVYVNGKALARVGDAIACGDTTAEGSPNVFAN